MDCHTNLTSAFLPLKASFSSTYGQKSFSIIFEKKLKVD
eukprot:UN25164